MGIINYINRLQYCLYIIVECVNSSYQARVLVFTYTIVMSDCLSDTLTRSIGTPKTSFLPHGRSSYSCVVPVSNLNAKYIIILSITIVFRLNLPVHASKTV